MFSSNLLLAIYSRISLAVFSLTLQTFPFVHQRCLFVFALFNLQGTGSLPLSRLACLFYHAHFRLSRTFFKFFQTFLSGFLLLAALSKLSHFSISVSVCQVLFYNSLIPVIRKKWEPEKGLPRYHLLFILYHQSGRSHLHSFDIQQQRNLRCPHPGKQRNYDSEDSSASQPLLWSWA